jgi:hypothetical protein
MLTGDQMRVINKGWLVKHSDFVCIFVVVERDGELLRLLQVNAVNPITYRCYVDNSRLTKLEIG